MEEIDPRKTTLPFPWTQIHAHLLDTYTLDNHPYSQPMRPYPLIKLEYPH